jgi:endonuclease YncB( thermonuclease family)
MVTVLDGATIEGLHNNRAERIRLNGIDCPDYSQVAPQNELELNRTIEAAGHCFQWKGWLQGDIAAWRLRTVHQ